MASDDAHQGGALSDMTVSGTKIPGDAGKQNLIPSVPRPDQQAENPQYHKQFINAPDQQGAVDNVTDLPRQYKDGGATGEVITGTGDQLPSQIESKRLHNGPNDALAKGHDRIDKHAKRNENESDFERYAGADATADAAPGDEELSQDQLRDRKGL